MHRASARARWITLAAVAAASGCAATPPGPFAGRLGAASPLLASARVSDPGAGSPASGAALSGAAAPAPPASGRRAAAVAAGCTLFSERSERSASAECLECHVRGKATSQLRWHHPLDREYARAEVERDGMRPAAEVVRRGVFLPDGQIRCVTCHDRRSPWASAVALPPGAKASSAVHRAPPASDASRPLDALLPGSRVTPKPLCLACHAKD